ncbi:MAG: carbohydrate kinase family protein [Clostridiales bacterium]|nr:carbohydrate kinase family protein [Clostridiales bacterium]
MKDKNIYLFGMVLASTSFLLKEFPKVDEYSEIKNIYRLPGGETGTCATVLSSLGINVKLDGNHIGRNISPLLNSFYKDKTVDLSSLNFDDNYDGLEDYIIISDKYRSPMGTFGNYFTNGEKRWNSPKEEDIINCSVAAIDPFFQEQSEQAARFCVKHGKPYVTIDCSFNSYVHQNAAISIISGEGIHLYYPDMSREELFPLFIEKSDGLTIITNGGNDLFYGRKGTKMKRFSPYKVDVVSTLGAGDSFKAGCSYALLNGMDDDNIIKFASACSAVAITKFPLPLNPPKINEIMDIINK